MNQPLLDLLCTLDTPTICNAIEVVQGQRGFNHFTRGTLLASAPQNGAIVGYARTAKIRALTPPDEAPEVIKKRRLDYYKYMSAGLRPSIAVIEDTDYPNPIGAFWGEINTYVHQGFGLGGALTNGVMRDLDCMPAGFNVIAGSIGPSHGFVHVLEFDKPVSIFGMPVAPDDLIHADKHGALVIPPAVISGLAAGIQTLLTNEKLILDAAKADGFNFEKFKIAWDAFEKART